MKPLTIKDLLKNISGGFDTENADFANFRNITGWSSKEISDFFDKSVNADFKEKEYHALGCFLFIHPNKGAKFKDSITSAGKAVINEFRTNKNIDVEMIRKIGQENINIRK